MRFERKRFFDGFRKWQDSVSQEQVDGLNFLLGGIERDSNIKLVSWAAYFLATAFHETAYSFQPVEEGYYLGEKKAKAHQKKLRYYPYFGRGYVQLTWEENYEKMTVALKRYYSGVVADFEKRTGQTFDLVKFPAQAKDPEIAAAVMFYGMRTGKFGTKLSQHLTNTRTDYKNARRTVNILDKAETIAGYARQFEKILKDSFVRFPDPVSTEQNTTATTISSNPIEIPAEIKPESVEVPDAVLPEGETVSAETTTTTEVATMTTTETEGQRTEVKTEKTETFGVKIPNINTAKTWLKYLFGGVTFGNIGAGFADLPPYIRISLAVSFIVLIIGTIILFALYYREIFDYVKAMNNLRADKDKHNPELS